MAGSRSRSSNCCSSRGHSRTAGSPNHTRCSCCRRSWASRSSSPCPSRDRSSQGRYRTRSDRSCSSTDRCRSDRNSPGKRLNFAHPHHCSSPRGPQSGAPVPIARPEWMLPRPTGRECHRRHHPTWRCVAVCRTQKAAVTEGGRRSISWRSEHSFGGWVALLSQPFPLQEQK